ncbi:MAG: hypothetical protein JWO98_2074 [Frankiales bacterium]|nr:hypothetical protein [Frankiales bacterium]
MHTAWLQLCRFADDHPAALFLIVAGALIVGSIALVLATGMAAAPATCTAG